MTNQIDVTKLSKKDQYKIVKEILEHNKELRQAIQKVTPNDTETISMEYIEKIISQDFKRYDEVFRRLA